ncbi:MAG: molybdate ABC transporter substrate-binding protein [Propionibacteriaceae bacterium]|jgi:molybdate transport system substrate-binding protein|nr:molybdate ABC transporter substrate-binding protein [Propionibacteriaceae bacterium]
MTPITQPRLRARFLPLCLGLAASLGLAACGGSAGSTTSSSAPPSSAAATTAQAPATSAAAATPTPAEATLTVYAAASLTATFTDLGAQFEAVHPGVTVTFNFAGSSDLAAQIIEGAPADVFASADENNMSKVTAENLIAGAPVLFATNSLMIAVPPDNPGGVTSLADLTNPDLAVVVCAPEVPCGAAAVKVEGIAGIDIQPVSEESKVTDVLAKVSSGDADAGLVYSTDVQGANGAVVGIAFPEAAQAVNNYPIGVVANAPQAALAQEFVDFVTGPTGAAVLAAAGFGQP